jgi:hypothetical protein
MRLAGGIEDAYVAAQALPAIRNRARRMAPKRFREAQLRYLDPVDRLEDKGFAVVHGEGREQLGHGIQQARMQQVRLGCVVRTDRIQPAQRLLVGPPDRSDVLEARAVLIAVRA